MCTSKPKAPPPPAPTPAPETVDPQAIAARDRERRRQRSMRGQPSTIITGPQGAAITAQQKTALGS